MPPIVRLEQSVIDRIAAGEVVQHPSAAFKELFENSIDAGATQINVTCHDGGMTLLQVRDNGHGIRREDLPLLCQRYATSKLTRFEDLSSIATFGFRGEALASMSYVAHVTVVTRTAEDPHAWEAKYESNYIVEGPIPAAGPIGTTITLADLFYSSPLRKQAFSKSTEEFTRICDIITRYAIANPGIAVTCQRVGVPRLDVSIPSSCADTRAVVANRFGDAVAKHLFHVTQPAAVEALPSAGDFTFDAWITGLEYTGSRSLLSIFVNRRLVSNTTLQRTVDHVYAPHLVPGAKSFVLLHISVDPTRVDVNVHPTKHEVLLLDEEHIAKAVFASIREQLAKHTTSARRITSGGVTEPRALPTSTCSSTPESAASQKPTVVASDRSVIAAPFRERGDRNRGAMERFLVPCTSTSSLTVSAPQVSSEQRGRSIDEMPRRSQPVAENETGHPPLACLRVPSDDDDDAEEDDRVAMRRKLVALVSSSLSASVDTQAPLAQRAGATIHPCEHDFVVTCTAAPPPPPAATPAQLQRSSTTTAAQECLASVSSILRAFDDASNNALRDVGSSMRYVGCIDADRILIQARSTLYLVHSKQLAFEVAQQLVFLQWGHWSAARYDVSPRDDDGQRGVSIRWLLRQSVLHDEGVRVQCKSTEQSTAVIHNAVARLWQWRDMLAEYFAIEVCGDEQEPRLVALPAVLGPTWPLHVRAIPLLLLRLVTAVDYSDERQALMGVGREVALFLASSEVSEDVPLREAVAEGARCGVRLPATMAADGALCAIVTVEALYRVFERC